MFKFRLDRSTSRMRCLGTAVAITMLALPGCGGDASGRMPLSGEVTFDGHALDRGTIEFHPREGGSGPTGGSIREGRFEIPAEQGAVAGTYTVKIYSAADGPADSQGELAPPGPESEQPPAAERIPARYNVASELQTPISDANAEELKFDLES